MPYPMIPSQTLCPVITPGGNPVIRAGGRYLDVVTGNLSTPAAQALLTRLAATFDIFPLDATGWEAELRLSTQPATLLSLWQTAADVFDHYTAGKKFSHLARRDYVVVIASFLNCGPLRTDWGHSLQSLKPTRATNVLDQMERYFRRHPLLRAPGPPIDSPDDAF